MHKNTYGKLPAYCISCFFDVFIKPFGVILLNQIHASMIKIRNVFMDLLALFKGLVCKVRSPMTEIWRNNENCILIIKVLRKSFSVFFRQLFINDSNYYRYYRDIAFLFKRSSDERQMHLNTVLFFLLFFCHLCVYYCLFELFYALIFMKSDTLFVNWEISKGCFKLLHVWKWATVEILMMRRT